MVRLLVFIINGRWTLNNDLFVIHAVFIIGMVNN